MHTKSLTNICKLPKEEIKKFLSSFDTVISDCDGVLWRGDTLIQGSSTVINRLRELGKRILFVTNNPGIVRDDLVKKCQKFNFICNKEEVLSSSYLVANYLQKQGFNKKVYVIGVEALAKELDYVNIKHTDIGPELEQTTLSDIIKIFKVDPEIGAVVVSFDPTFTYAKMLKAATYLNNPDCLFVASDTDERIPSITDLVVPGPGGMVEAIKTASDREPFIVGKPNRYIADMLIDKYGVVPNKTLIIGDNCKTDILLETRCKFQTLLVLTGITTIEEVNNYKNSDSAQHKDLIPDFYADKLVDLLPYLD